ncbi:GNAT family N-acetyltransferase [Paraferrimonas sedimenticola]|uniref:N-acetyltransferase GCN5 n=1 Tax=Paraferrimonas sedimenticola TaxID=375674 RepID=A0AA37W1E3_9GAMM|nr:N-acetyltransferase [Paraferrimonas sedimenticola]GLP97270.1 N-acetyltransferase GCN5 [Paraferrimonas sedimenticola]
MLTVRPATPKDLAALVAFNQAMAAETEGRQLPTEVLEKGVGTLLNEPQRGFYLVAQRDSQVLGSLMVTFEWSDWQAKDYWWIQSVYVAPQARRQGIYRALYDQVKQLAQSQAASFRLYVERDNLAAQQTYQALGMEPCQYLMYEQKSDLS